MSKFLGDDRAAAVLQVGGRAVLLPAAPNAGLLRRVLQGGAAVGIARPRQNAQDATPGFLVSSWISLAEITGRAMDPARLIHEVRKFSWVDTFGKLAYLAGVITNQPDGALGEETHSWTTGLLASQAASLNPYHALIGSYLARMPRGRVIAHEKVIYFLQAMAIHYGQEKGPVPSDGDIAYLMLAANDHVTAWRKPGRPLSDLEQGLADACQSTRYNHHPDPLLRLSRAAMILREPPHRGRWLNDPSVWSPLLVDAFGRPVDEFMEMFLAPLVIASARWGRGSDPMDLPVISSIWHSQTRVTAAESTAFFDRVSVDRAAAQRALRLRDDGLPETPTLFFRRPFVRISDDRIVASSPAAVSELLRGGLWGMCRDATGRRFESVLGADAATKEWTDSFGYVFEGWCWRVAEEAARSPHFSATLVLPDKAGKGEVADVVLRAGRRLALFSAKARLLPEGAARGAQSPSAIIDWHRETLIDDAVVQLDSSIERLRITGQLSDVDEIFPIIVLFEEPGENGVLYRWMREESASRRLLKRAGVRQVAVISVDVFEQFMALAAGGADPFEILSERERREGEWRLDAVISDRLNETSAPKRLEFLEREFSDLGDRMRARLFGVEPREGDHDG